MDEETRIVPTRDSIGDEDRSAEGGQQTLFDLEPVEETGVSCQEALERSQAAQRVWERRGIEQLQEQEAPAWMTVYWWLREQGWSWRKATYMAWEASPRMNRWPGTVEELATDVLGMTSARQIYKWRQNKSLLETVAQLRISPLMAHLPEVWAAFLNVAKRADYKSIPAMKMVFEMAGIYEQRVVHRNEEGRPDLSKMSYEELIAYQEELRREQTARGAEVIQGVFADDDSE